MRSLILPLAFLLCIATQAQTMRQRVLVQFSGVVVTDSLLPVPFTTILVKNTYRVLLTRGQKGCYVCFLDKDTENYFRSRIRRGSSDQPT